MAESGPLIIDDSVAPRLRPVLAAAVGALGFLAPGDAWPSLTLLRRRAEEPAAWLVRLGPEGITWREGPSLAWSAIAEVRLPARERRRTRWGRRLGPGTVTVVTHAQLAWAARAGARPYGVPVRVSWSVSPADIAAAVRRFSDAPVR